MSDSETLSFKVTKPSRTDPKPRSASPRAKANATTEQVEKAVAVMNNVYRAAGVGLVFAQLPQTAEKLADEKDGLEAANREAFTASPKLAEFIGNAGNVSTIATFFVAHGFALVNIVGTARQETAAKRREREKDRPAETDIENGSTASNVGGILYGVPQTVATG